MRENILSRNTSQIAIFFFVHKCHVASGTLSGQGPRGYTTEHRINLIRGTKHDPLCSVGGRAGPEQNA